MRYRRLDESGDMMPVTDVIKHCTDAEAVGAAIRSRLLSFYGEWWESPDEGIPVDAMVGRLNEENKRIAEALIRNRIGGTEGVLRIIDLSISDDPATRKRSVFCRVETEFGETTVEVV